MASYVHGKNVLLEGRPSTTVGEPYQSALEYAAERAQGEPVYILGTDVEPYRYATLKYGTFDKPLILVGVDRPRIGTNPTGSSDSLFLKRGDLYLSGFDIDPDDRAGVKTALSTPIDNVVMKDIRVNGNYSLSTEKWAFHTYGTSNWHLERVHVKNIIREKLEDGQDAPGGQEEHCHYWHPHGKVERHVMRLCSGEYAARTFTQARSSKWEGPHPEPGTWLFDRCSAKDVCLETGGGGSAYTFSGQYRQAITLRGCSAYLGCDERLAHLFPGREKNITGCLSMHQPSDSYGHANILSIQGCHFEVGKVFPGEGNARRTNVFIEGVKHLEIGPYGSQKTRIINHFEKDGKPWAVKRCLDIQAHTVDAMRLSRDGVETQGEILYGGDSFQSWADFIKAVEGKPGVEVVA